MKVLAFILTLALLGSSINAVSADERDLGDVVKNVLNIIFSLIPADSCSRKTTDIPLTIDNDYLKAQFNITEIAVSNLCDITIDDIGADLDSFTLNFHFNDIHIHFDRLFSFNLFGLVGYENHDLDISIDLEDLSVASHITFNILLQEISNVDVKINLESSEFVFDRLLVSDELSEKVGTYLGTFVPEKFNTFFKATSKEFNAALKQALNELLKQVIGNN